MDSVQILKDLIGFPTVSRDSNLALINYVEALLNDRGIAPLIIHSKDGKKANLFATIGPSDRGGVLLSGHTDVVPVDGQKWTLPPFEMTQRDGLLYGRGSADMKGFIAAALATSQKASRMPLRAPLHLALSYDEEIGCIGIRSLVNMLQEIPHRPLLCIVGEPTDMQVATGHKGKLFARAICKGRESHSALAPHALNAIHLACDFVGALRAEQDRLEIGGARDGDYTIPYTTIHAGRMNGGVALNIVPSLCEIDFEIRNVAADDPESILQHLRGAAARIVTEANARVPEAEIEIELVNGYPGLDTLPNSDAVAFVKSLVGATDSMKVSFGTEGGLISRDLGTPTVICGPGSMTQGHMPDEFVSVEQMRRCDNMLNALLERLCAGGI